MSDRAVVDMLEENNIQRFEARRRQAARSGRGGTGERRRAQIGRSSSAGVHVTSSPRVSSFPRGAGGRHTPMPGLFLSALLFLGIGFFCIGIVLKRAIWGG